MVLADFGSGQFLWSMIWFTLFFIWIWLLIIVFMDVFRSHDLGGFAKFLWVLFIIILPYLGVFVYLIARGHKMAEHAAEAQQAQVDYIRQVAGSGGGSAAEELQRLSDLKSKGVIDDAEFNRLKAKIVG